MNIIENIKLRRSVRTFRKEALTEATTTYIKNYLQEHTGSMGPLGHTINLFEIEVDSPKQLGTYGIIKNPPKYIAGTCDNTDKALIDFGYVFERMILDFASEKLGTCWMGGTFKRADFEKRILKDSLELMPAVTPVGYFDDKRTFETVMRKLVKADNRLTFDSLFFMSDFSKGLDESEALDLREPLESVRLGPSASNKQPWRVVVSDDLKQAHFYLEKTPNYSKALGYNIQMLDMGIAMYHFEVSCDSVNIKGHWEDSNPKIKHPNKNYEYIMTYTQNS